MIWLLCFVMAALTSRFKSKIRLEAENATLRHQLVVLRRQRKGRARLSNDDRWFFVQLYRWFPSILPALMNIQPKRWYVGIGPAFAAIGVANRVDGEGGRAELRVPDPADEHGEFALGCATYSRRTAQARV